ncbi:hypothetical protein C8R48DRAFT_672645 [Suillus tomentosus]|nr:hypothetical protein C8R48DRAFT_672645 [Suillus tomentosus]
MSTFDSYNTIVFGDSQNHSVSDTSPIGYFDNYIIPEGKDTLGFGDTILVYWFFYTLLTSPLPLMVFGATLGSISSQGSNHVEFCLHDLYTRVLLEKSIKLPLSIARLSIECYWHLSHFDLMYIKDPLSYLVHPSSLSSAFPSSKKFKYLLALVCSLLYISTVVGKNNSPNQTLLWVTVYSLWSTILSTALNCEVIA